MSSQGDRAGTTMHTYDLHGLKVLQLRTLRMFPLVEEFVNCYVYEHWCYSRDGWP